MSKARLFVFFCACFVFADGIALAQTMQDVYKADTFAEKRGEEEWRVASYFIQLGLDEQRSARHRGEMDSEEIASLIALNEALSPINELQSMRKTNPEDPEIGKKIRMLQFDETIAKRVFDALGPEKAQLRVSQRVFRSLKSLAEASKTNAFSQTTFLENEDFASILKLSDSQKNAIAELVDKVSENVRYGSPVLQKKWEDLLSGHYEQVCGVLTASQRKVVEALVGEPVQWFRCVEEKQLRSRIFGVGGASFIGAACHRYAEKTGKNVYQQTASELKGHGIVFFHGHQYEMLKSPFVWDEVELSEEQREKLRVGLDKFISDKGIVVPNQNLHRLENLLKDKASVYPNYIVELLSAEQLGWFKNMEFQVLTGQFESSFGILHPLSIRNLELKKSQLDELKNLADEFMNEAELLDEELKESRVKVVGEFRKKIGDVLLERQVLLYEKITGSKLEEMKMGKSTLR